MLRNTFCHISGIGPKTEQKLWAAGIHEWDIFFQTQYIPLSVRKIASMVPSLEESIDHLAVMNPFFFGKYLPVNEHWRLFSEFRDTIAYIDIETTGLEPWCDEITTIALYDGQSMYTYVNGQNLEEFITDIQRYKIIVTYNGRCFDVPFIQQYFKVYLNHVHIDLRYLLKSLGFSGGLKACEQQLGIDRGELSGVDGYEAVLLWYDYKRTGNTKSLEKLLEYNSADAKNLETLLVRAYNMKLKGTPFYETGRIL